MEKRRSKKLPACPCCKLRNKVIKKGKSKPRLDQKRVQRFYCKSCNKYFSEQTLNFDYRLRIRYVNQTIFRFLATGVSQRALAKNLKLNRKVVDLRVKRFGGYCKRKLDEMRKQLEIENLGFDEMESFEHSKCKPLTMPIAVDMDTRKIVSVSVGNIAAKGKLAEISRKKYGKRVCERVKVLEKLFHEITHSVKKSATFLSDKSKHYPSKLKKYFPEAVHLSYKGRKACVVGQGELKEGFRDPLFNLNHCYAMIRDNIKRLTRKTWCTTKKKERLEDFLNIYAYYHNLYLERVLPSLGLSL